MKITSVEKFENVGFIIFSENGYVYKKTAPKRRDKNESPEVQKVMCEKGRSTKWG